jgi:hypothetical protein
MDPETSRPAGPFEAASDVKASGSGVLTEPSPQARSNATFGIKLSNNGLPMGWLGRDPSGWAVLSDTPLLLEQYLHSDKKTYFKIPGESTYMSLSGNAYIGFYGWTGATAFHMDGEHLVSDHNSQKLSMYSTGNRYLYCWDKYEILQVALTTQ